MCVEKLEARLRRRASAPLAHTSFSLSGGALVQSRTVALKP
tara:strand:- start:351 stop:473 length:123 start_codon:yes stop_codon:yes gene_type:complete